MKEVHIPRLDFEFKRDPFDLGCPRCGFLLRERLDIYFSKDRIKHIYELFDKYQIDEYRARLSELNEKFQIHGLADELKSELGVQAYQFKQ